MELVIMGIMIMIATGCGSFFKRSGGNNNIIMAVAIYDDVKSDDARSTMLREEVFHELQQEIRKSRQDQIPVNFIFDSISWLNNRHIEFVKKVVRRYIKPPKLATAPKTILLKDFQDIVDKILNYYYSDSLKNIVPTWGK